MDRSAAQSAFINRTATRSHTALLAAFCATVILSAVLVSATVCHGDAARMPRQATTGTGATLRADPGSAASARVLFALRTAPRFETPLTTWDAAVLNAGLMAIGLAVYSFSLRPVRFGPGIAAILFGFHLSEDSAVLLTQRSFYGVHRVAFDRAGRYLVYCHGTTIHGAEYRDPARFREPLSYYHRDSPIGHLFASYPDPSRFVHVSVVGLGAGAVTCYPQPGQIRDLYEIDPDVIYLAWHAGYFHYLGECSPESRTIQGDARRSLAKAPDHYYDLMILDAYTSDAIPVHLITREAIALYKRTLTDRGIIVASISKRYLSLGNLLATQMDDAGLTARISVVPERDPERYDRRVAEFRFGSRWVAAGLTPDVLSRLDSDNQWRPRVRRGHQRVWTDDYSNLLAILRLE